MPTQALDPRVIKVSIEVNGVLKTYSEPLNIVASGTKYGNSLQNEAEITIYNLDKQTQDYILTETSPYVLNRTPKLVILEAGRQSYGTAVIYRGNITNSIVSQPPDIGITLKCLTGNFLKGNIISRNQPGQASLRRIATQVSQDTDTVLNFQATDKNIGNYQFAGGALKQVEAVGNLGNLNVFIDDNTLVVKDAFIPLNNTLRILNVESGMIGIPEFTEQGIKVKMLLDNQTKLGGGLRIQSKQYPAANGDYVIYKLGFEIATRDTPFYYIAEAARRR
jgi:hypothetical protein